ncbi:unnamed protein product [Haemonchus placei]|uniref:SAYSvFN domain-containing protein n=1 Tax=Haemonchus placei TaxID=6290 RepID=A0A0N4WAK8_HAEPC|nr:unnamed protein product [Haemonchus placei]
MNKATEKLMAYRREAQKKCAEATGDNVPVEPEKMSAYSVFNPNCERLLGQMTAEHFERDVLRRRID